MVYVAVVLTENSKEKIIKKFSEFIPEDWEIIAHHMTMYMGKIKTSDKNLLGQYVTMTVNFIGKDNFVIALGVTPWEVTSDNKMPHITLAVNRKIGGKPVMSNKLNKWAIIEEPFIVRGIVSQE